MRKLKRKIYGLTDNYRLVDFVYKKMHAIKVNYRKNLSDIEFANKKYYEVTGKYLNLDNPQTFDEKQWWLKLYYRDPRMTICADKYRVRSYVTECGLKHILNELYGVYYRTEDIEFEKLPEQFILKTNHGCGGNYICKNKYDLRKESICKRLNKSLKNNYYYQSREWVYKEIPPRIIAEKLLTNSNGEKLLDYRLLCFNGKCRYVFIDIDTCDETGRHKSNAKRNVYDENMKLLDVQVSRERFNPLLVSKPTEFYKMREYAEILSKPFPFCRVDFYYVNEKIVFGEMTFFHSGGTSIIDPPEMAYTMGSWLKLPDKNI